MSVKRYAIAAGAAALVFSGVYGAAAALAVDGGALQTGQDTLVCDSNGVEVVGYGYENDTQQFSYVRVGDVDTACTGADMLVVVRGGGQQLADGVAVVDGPEVRVNLDQPVNGEAAESVQITIEG